MRNLRSTLPWLGSFCVLLGCAEGAPSSGAEAPVETSDGTVSGAPRPAVTPSGTPPTGNAPSEPPSDAPEVAGTLPLNPGATANAPATSDPDQGHDDSDTPPPGTDLEPDAEHETCNLPGAAGPATPTIWIIGDSTASRYEADLYPRTGWAQPLQDYFAPACATIEDRAISGRSSKSFLDEGAWTPIADALRAGDFVLIQFGHNDEKSDDPVRFTEPFTTFQGYLSTYIDETLAHGATPVLLTPINRNNWTGATIRDTHGDYPVAMRQLAAERQVALIDATALTQTYFEGLGEAATTALFMNLAAGQFPNYPDGNSDNTHLREEGARAIGQLILADFARQGLPIGRLLKAIPDAP